MSDIFDGTPNLTLGEAQEWFRVANGPLGRKALKMIHLEAVEQALRLSTFDITEPGTAAKFTKQQGYVAGLRRAIDILMEKPDGRDDNPDTRD